MNNNSNTNKHARSSSWSPPQHNNNNTPNIQNAEDNSTTNTGYAGLNQHLGSERYLHTISQNTIKSTATLSNIPEAATYGYSKGNERSTAQPQINTRLNPQHSGDDRADDTARDSMKEDRFHRLSRPLSTLKFLLLFAVIFLLPALLLQWSTNQTFASLFALQSDGSLMDATSLTNWVAIKQEISRWLLLTYIAIGIFVVLRLIIYDFHIPVAYLIDQLYHTHVQNFHHFHTYVRAVRTLLTATLTSILVTISLIVVVPGCIDDGTYQQYVLLTSVALDVSMVLALLEKVLIQKLSVEFHKVAYKDRVEVHKYQTTIIKSLNNAIASHRLSPVSSKIPKVFRRERSPSPSYSLHKGFRSEDNVSIRSLASNEDLKSLAGGGQKEECKVYRGRSPARKLSSQDKTAATEASRLARRLYHALSDWQQGGLLPLESFLPWFSDTVEAQRAFDLFDPEKNGSVSKKELEQILVEFFLERSRLANCLRDLNTTMGKLDKVLQMIVLLLATVLWVIILSKGKVLSGLISFSSVFLGLSFTFGDAAKSLFNSAVFLFVIHPFDVGDTIMIGTDTFQVAEMHLWTTILRRSDGTIITYPNASTLYTIPISNIRRSGAMSERYYLNIDVKTSSSALAELQERINRHVQDHQQRDFMTQHIDLNIWDTKTMIDRLVIRDTFINRLKELLLELNIESPSYTISLNQP